MALYKYPDASEVALTMMPPYAGDKNGMNPLIKRLKTTQSVSRAKTRIETVEEDSLRTKLANANMSNYNNSSTVSNNLQMKAIMGSSSVDQSLLVSNQTPKAMQNHRPMSTAKVTSPKLSPEINQRQLSPVRNSKDLHSNLQLVNASSSSSDDSGDSSESEDSDALPPRTLWRNLCICVQGSFYTSKNLNLSLKHEYKNGHGRLAIYFVNRSKNEQIQNLCIDIQM